MEPLAISKSLLQETVSLLFLTLAEAESWRQANYN